METLDFVAKLERNVGYLGTHYLKVVSEVRTLLWDSALKPVESDTKLVSRIGLNYTSCCPELEN